MKIRNIIITLALFLISGALKSAEYYQATVQLNIRSGVGTSYEVVGSITQGEKVLIDTIISGWGRVIVDGKPIGYASMKYLTTDFTAYPDSSKSIKKEENPWTTILGLSILGAIAIYHLFFKGDKTATQQSKVMANHWWHCSGCNTKVNQPNEPRNSNSCTNRQFHKFKDYGMEGSDFYTCGNCGLTINTKGEPRNRNACSHNRQFHSWRKL